MDFGTLLFFKKNRAHLRLIPENSPHRYKYAMERPVIDGGSLGTLAWCLPVVVGSLLYDWQVWSIARWNAYKDGKEVIDVRIRKWRVLSYPRLESELTWKVIRMIGFPFVVGIALMLIGYLLSCITVSPICFEVSPLKKKKNSSDPNSSI